MPRFLACGDLHLDAGPDLGRNPGDRLREQQKVWARALEIAVEEDCDGVLFAGDAFDKRRPSPEAMLAFERPLVSFMGNPRGGQIVAIPGNHDVASVNLGTGLEIFAEAGLLELAREPEVVELAGVSIVCLPWAPTAWLVASEGGRDRDQINEQAAELLVNVARGLRAQVSGPAVLLTHFSISGSALPSGLPVEQLREPVLELADLEALRFDAVISGHIHKPQLLGDDIRTLYVGSPLPLNFGEANDHHGVWVLGINPFSADFIPISSRRLVTIDMDADVIGEIPVVYYADGTDPQFDGAIVKVRIKATQEQARRLDIAAFKRHLYDAGAHKVWAVQMEIERPERARVEGLTEELDELAALELWLEASGVNGDQAAALRERTERYLGVVRA